MGKRKPEFGSKVMRQWIGRQLAVIGLTGGIACGKSTVSSIFAQNQVTIIDADQIAREIVQPGKLSYRLICYFFGKAVLQEDGSIDREKLGKIIFSERKKRTLLNRCTHVCVSLTIFLMELEFVS